MFVALAIAIAVALMGAGTLAAPGPQQGAARKFYDDDPIAHVPETADASGAQSQEVELFVDLMVNLFARPGDPARNVRAQNLNTIDEVPDSSWFTNRIGTRAIALDEAVRGPSTGRPPAATRWTLVQAKSAGFSPGFTAKDADGETWFLTFDARGYPEAATGAFMVANRIFWTLGYWQVEAFLTTVRPEDVTIEDRVTIGTPSGRRRAFTRDDLDDVLRLAERSPDGTYRAVATRRVPGRVVGRFKYFGTRSDDPNDLVAHEHRRELRALKVFGAWTNLTDLKAGNTLDTVVEQNGHGVIRHYLQDVGSTFGIGALGPHDWDEGWEYLYEGDTLWKRLVTVGFYIQPWQTADYREFPSIGRFEGDAFDPLRWKPHAPTAAFLHARADDSFWAARRVGAFSDELIRGLVGAGQYSDPRAAAYLAEVLIKRRDKILRTYLPAINPLVDFALDDRGTLTFTNAAVTAGVAEPPAGGYEATWASYDNASGAVRPMGTAMTGEPGALKSPEGLPSPSGAIVKVQVRSVRSPHAAWTTPVDVYFRRAEGGWKLIGLERLP